MPTGLRVADFIVVVIAADDDAGSIVRSITVTGSVGMFGR